jgi:hypothetical protein
MFTAKITGVIPKGMSLPAAPVETKQFASLVEAKQWLLGEALYNLHTPVEKVEVFSAMGSQSGGSGIGATMRSSQRASCGGMQRTPAGKSVRRRKRSVGGKCRRAKSPIINSRSKTNLKSRIRLGAGRSSLG